MLKELWNQDKIFFAMLMWCNFSFFGVCKKKKMKLLPVWKTGSSQRKANVCRAPATLCSIAYVHFKNGIRFNTWHFVRLNQKNHLLEGRSEASFFVVIDTSHSSLEHSKQQRNKHKYFSILSLAAKKNNETNYNERLENDRNFLDENCLYYSTVWCCLSFNKLETKPTNEAVDMILIT